MTISDTTQTPGSGTLDEIGRQLQASLRRRVAIRETGAGSGTAGERGLPDVVDESRFTVPVHHDGAVIASMAIRTDDRRPLTPDDFAAVDAAAELIRLALRRRRGTSGSDRESIVRDLLHTEESVRRSAYRRGLSQRWLRPEAGTVVRAVLTDSTASDVDRVAFGRHLAHLRPVPAFFLTLEGSVLVLVGQPSEQDLSDVILQEAARRGIRILGIGSASPAQGATDLRSAADEAAIAASLAAALPQFHPSVDASALGGWRLLASASADPASLRIISPAAHLLHSLRDPTPRLTVETYLDVGGNVPAACRLLFIHRTTLYYRLDRMPEVVRAALDDGIQRSTLHLALKLVRLWESTGRR